MITYLLIVALVLFAVTLWYFTAYLARLNVHFASLEFRLEAYRHEQELAGLVGEREMAIEKALQGQRNYFTGTILERFFHLAPGYPYDPADIVAVSGSGLFDFLVIEGRSVGKIVGVVFQEMKGSVKSIKSTRLNPLQRQLRDVIQAGKVRHEEWQMGGPDDKGHLYVPRNKRIGGE